MEAEAKGVEVSKSFVEDYFSAQSQVFFIIRDFGTQDPHNTMGCLSRPPQSLRSPKLPVAARSSRAKGDSPYLGLWSQITR